MILINGIFLVAGMAFGFTVAMIAWYLDTREEEKRIQTAKAQGYRDGLAEGKRWRFREKCRFERKCNELEARVLEMENEVQV